jgi:cyclopropane fatty-acyl-phospholipid synthase-like methyltransferase
VDYSRRETTTDQSEIEAALEATPLEGKRILHVGIGNSGLARRFAPRALAVEGLTVSAAELAHASALGISNYRPRLLNKHDPRLSAVSAEPFDIIVDNNLAAYACCKHHLYVMFESYAALMRPGGELFTHKLGMEWTAGDPRWRLTDDDLDQLASTFGFRVRRAAGGVRVLVASDQAYVDRGSQTPSSRASSAR